MSSERKDTLKKRLDENYTSSLFTIKLFEHFCNFFRYFHEAI